MVAGHSAQNVVHNAVDLDVHGEFHRLTNYVVFRRRSLRRHKLNNEYARTGRFASRQKSSPSLMQHKELFGPRVIVPSVRIEYRKTQGKAMIISRRTAMIGAAGLAAAAASVSANEIADAAVKSEGSEVLPTCGRRSIWSRRRSCTRTSRRPSSRRRSWNSR